MAGHPTAVVVTGAGSGLGRATALRVARTGRGVAAWDIDAEAAEAVAAEVRALDVPSVAHQVDVADRAAVFAAAERTSSELGAIGGLVCAAGIIRVDPIGTIEPENWDRVLAVNTNGVLYAIESLVEQLKASGERSSIVVIASTGAVRGSRMLTAYTASKHAALGIVRSVALVLGRDGIRVNAVCPGAMQTPMLDQLLGERHENATDVMAGFRSTIALGYVAAPDEVANVVNFMLTAEASYITGQAIVVDGGMTA